jgi:hypothetical protein
MRSGRSTLRTVVVAGLVSGTVDIGAAALINRLSPVVILDAVASGWLGEAAFSGGAGTALLGLLLQWVMAMLIAAIYLACTAPLGRLRHRWQLAGVCAGVVIFLVMNYLVVPLSAAPFRPKLELHSLLTAFGPYKLVANLLAMILFGLIIAFFGRNLTRRLS